MRILSFDFGTKKIGVAIGQNVTCTATALKYIHVKDGIPDWNQIQKIILHWIPKKIIIGYPLKMDGTKQLITKKTILFAKLLHKKFLINIQFQDERLTTKESKSILYAIGGYKKIKDTNIDSFSAILIAESWFNSNQFNKVMNRNMIQ